MKRGLARDTKTVPPLRTGTPLPAEKVALVDLLRVLLKACAARHRVAPRLIADGDDLERIAVEDDPDVAALKGWRYDLFGADAEQLKRGELALKARVTARSYGRRCLVRNSSTVRPNLSRLRRAYRRRRARTRWGSLRSRR